MCLGGMYLAINILERLDLRMWTRSEETVDFQNHIPAVLWFSIMGLAYFLCLGWIISSPNQTSTAVNWLKELERTPQLRRDDCARTVAV